MTRQQYLQCFHAQRGFTLVELSIVLVIIGLIVSSVLVGQDLIRQGELRATVTQYEQITAATATFKTKYGALPGDIRADQQFGLGVATTTTHANGTYGNNIIESHSVARQHDGELVYFWNHLGSAGAALISGSFSGAVVGGANTLNLVTPQAKSGGNWGIYSVGAINYLIIGNASTATPFVTASALTPLDASSIDQKVDDGRPSRGIAQARGASATDPDTAATTTATGCVVAATGIYNTAGTTSEQCTLRLRLSI